MPVCQNGHDQPDFAKFCGICGSSVVPANALDQDMNEPASGDSDLQMQIDLDLLSDEGQDLISAEDQTPISTEDGVDAGNLHDGKTVEESGADGELADGELADGELADGELADGELADSEISNADDNDLTSNAFDDETEISVDLNENFDATADPSQTIVFGTTVNASAMQLLHDWAEEVEELEDPYIKGLTTAIARRDDLSVWASLDPLELLPVSKALKWNRLGRVANIVSAVRNILVFVPVLLTWLAIGRAIDAFGEFTKAYAEKNPGTATNLSFIEFWQDPNGYLDGWWQKSGNGKSLLGDFWRIGDVAAFDAYIILLIILLTAISGAITWFAEKRESSYNEQADRKRIEVGLAITTALHGKRQANPESISEALAEALNDLTQAARDVKETALRLEQASIGVESLTPRIETLNSHTELLVAQTATSVTKAVSDLVSSVQNLNSSVSGNVTALFSDAVNTLEEVCKQLSRTSNSAEYGIKQLRDDLDAVHKQLQSLTKGGRP